jgi:hypothetical protein
MVSGSTEFNVARTPSRGCGRMYGPDCAFHSLFDLLARRHKEVRYEPIHVHNIPDFLVFAAWYPKWSGAKLIHGDQSSRTLRANPLWRTNARA